MINLRYFEFQCKPRSSPVASITDTDEGVINSLAYNMLPSPLDKLIIDETISCFASSFLSVITSNSTIVLPFLKIK